MKVIDSIPGVAGHRILSLSPEETVDTSEIIAALTDKGYDADLAEEMVGQVYDTLEEIAMVRNNPAIFAL